MGLLQSFRSLVTESVTNSKLNAMTGVVNSKLSAATRKEYGFLLKSAVFGLKNSIFLKKIKKLKKIS